MSIINVTNVACLDNPAKFSEPFRFEITFECGLPGLKEDLEWRLVYVGSAEDEKYDQELDVTMVGPVAVGTSKFTFECPAPNPALIPEADLLEVTVLLLTCSYKDKEFIRIGFYVNNDYGDNLQLKENPPPKVDIAHLVRTILADKPRVTRFQIPWDEPVVPIEAATAAAAAGGSECKSHLPSGSSGSSGSGCWVMENLDMGGEVAATTNAATDADADGGAGAGSHSGVVMMDTGA